MKRKFRTKLLLVPSLLLLFGLFSASSFAQGFPTKPISMLVAVAPGSPQDVTTRVLVSKAAPKGTPAPIVKQLDDAFRKAMDDPEFIQTMGRFEMDVSYRNSEELKKYLEEIYAYYGRLVRDFNIPKEPEKK